MIAPMRTPTNRGFSNPRARRYVAPTVARYRSSANLAGAPAIGRRHFLKKWQPYPDVPYWWQGPKNEWIVFWYLTFVKHWQKDKDFYYQAPVFAPFLFSSRDFTRVDFLIDLGPNSAAGAIGRYKAIGLDPITPFTHPDPAFDRRRRDELEEAGYLLVFLEGAMLETNPRDVIEKALRGQDISSRNRL